MDTLQRCMENLQKVEFLENVTVLIAILDKEKNLVWANKAYQNTVGCSMQELLGKKCYSFWGHSEPCENCPAPVMLLQPGSRNRTEPQTQYGVLSEGRYLSQASPIKDAGENVIGTMEVIFNVTEQMQAEEELQKASKLQDVILKNSAIGIAFVRDRIFEWVNPRMSEIFGMDAEEFKGSSTRIIYPSQEAYEREGRNMYPIFAMGKRGASEIRLQRKDGSPFWGRIEGAALDASNPYKGSIWMVEDVTERRDAENLLRESEERYRTIFEKSGMASAIITEDTTILLANSEFVKLSGYSKDEIEGKMSWTSFVAEEDLRWMLDFNKKRRFAPDSVPWAYEFRFVNRKGETLHVLNHVAGIPGSTQVIASMINITDRKIAEERIIRSENKFLKAFKYSPIAMSVSTLNDGRFRDVNEAFLQAMKYSRDEVIGKSSEELGMFIDERQRSRILSEIRKQGYIRNHEVAVRTRTGGTRYGLLSGSVIDSDNEPFLMTQTTDITERKQAEEALRHSQRELREAQRISRLCSWDWDAKTDTITWSEEYFNIYGLDPQQPPQSNKEYLNTLTPESTALLYAAAKQSIKTGEPYELDLEKIYPDGTKGWITTRGEAKRDENGLITGLRGTTQDISQRKFAEKKLKESEDRYRTYMDATSDMVFLKDEQFRYVVANKSLAVFSKKPQEEILGKDDFELMPASLAEMCRETDLKALKQMTVLISEEMFDGQFYETTKFPVQLGEGRNGVGGLIRNITSRKEVEEALKEREEFLSSIIENIPNMIFIKDAKELKFVRFNEAGEKLLGINRKELLGKSDRDVFPIEQADHFNQKDMEALQSRSLIDIPEEPIDVKTGRRILHTKKMPIFDKNGQPAYVLGISEDITEKLALESQMRQSQKLEAIGRLAGGVAHDFNNMLFVISGCAQLAIGETNPGDPVHGFLTEIQGAAKRSAEITRQLLAFARSQAINPKVLDLNSCIEGMLKMIRRLIGENIELNLIKGEALWTVKMDNSQVDQILANLCINARDSIVNRGRICINTKNVTISDFDSISHGDIGTGDFVLLAVSDDGSGMDEGTLAKIFEPFFTTKDVGRGTGLGLPTVYGIVKQNNGFINVKSEPSVGTTFEIFLPRYVSVDGVSSERKTDKLRKSRGETVLVVDDESAITEMTRIMLEKLGYTVFTANLPEKALEIAAERKCGIDLLLTDVVMPEMNGCELMERMVAFCPGMKTLLMSGYQSDIVLSQGMKDNDVNFIQKPLSLKLLAEKIREVLE
jgi:two-component system, cell cycle sensor histidine kinase and response regulator CckA